MRVLELANDQTANRGEQLGHSYNVLRYGKSSYNRGSVDGHGKSYNVRMGVVFEDQSNLDTPVDGSREGTVEPGMSFDCFNGDWKWHTTVTINKALINQMRLDILVGNQLKDEIYKPFELLDPDQRLEGSYDVQTIGGKVWRNLCWITSRVDKKTLERARNIFDSNYLEKNWEVRLLTSFLLRLRIDQAEVILRLPTIPYGHSSRKRDGDNTRRPDASELPARPRDKDIEGERVEVSRMKRMRMEVKTTYIYKAMNVTKGSSQEMGLAKVSDGVFAMIGAVEGYRQSWDERHGQGHQEDGWLAGSEVCGTRLKPSTGQIKI
ncbi:hypothetical protein BY996DRAFT_6613768 [Phakopsora pachyrhizi]|nr:hypothetical protein BY996DRAFT_6613768 [Phakopsora pachyrhizi]